MAEKHPYVSGSGSLVKIVEQLRRSFPSVVNAGTLRKLRIAKNNETYLLNVLRYLNVIDAEGAKQERAASVFLLHDDKQFAERFSELVKAAYQDVFDLHGDASWTLDRDSLIAFFRSADQSSEIVGKLQASTFQALAQISGRRETASAKESPPRRRRTDAAAKGARKKELPLPDSSTPVLPRPTPRDFGLTVRIEINLPSDADQATYDAIFRSIRENLINA